MSSIEYLPVLIGYNIGATSQYQLGEPSVAGYRSHESRPREIRHHDCSPIREHRYKNTSNTVLDYAEPERVSSSPPTSVAGG